MTSHSEVPESVFKCRWVCLTLKSPLSARPLSALMWGSHSDNGASTGWLPACGPRASPECRQNGEGPLSVRLAHRDPQSQRLRPVLRILHYLTVQILRPACLSSAVQKLRRGELGRHERALSSRREIDRPELRHGSRDKSSSIEH